MTSAPPLASTEMRLGRRKLPAELVDRENFLINECHGRRVLHLGCTDAPYTRQRLQTGTWLHSKLTEVASECIGLDCDEDGVAMLQRDLGINNVVVGSAEALDRLNLGEFDIVLAGELIEHLSNPGLMLSTASSALRPDGKLIITTVNAFCLRRMLRIPFGSESVHPDHVCYYSHSTLASLVSRFGYELIAAHSYRLRGMRPFVPCITERLSTLLSPNFGEGIIHTYRPVLC